MHDAAFNGHEAVVQMLLKAGADVKAVNKVRACVRGGWGGERVWGGGGIGVWGLGERVGLSLSLSLSLSLYACVRCKPDTLNPKPCTLNPRP